MDTPGTPPVTAPDLVDPFDAGALATLLADEPAFRTRQVQAWLRRGVEDPDLMTDLPQALRERLRERLVPAPEVVRHTTADGGLTQKVLLRYGAAPGVEGRGEAGEAGGPAGVGEAGGPAGLAALGEAGGPGDAGEAVESVLMLYPREGRRARATVCVSTQAGCAMACPFCATGQAGLRRQLTLGEVLRQVTTMQRLLATGGLAADHVTNVVFMGMGEPLANLDVTLEAIRWLHDPEGFGLSARGITVSTVGLVPGIRKLGELDLPVTLAVSLHAPDDALRDDLVPVNRTFPLAQLLEACREWRAATSRRLTFEYVLIDGVNDSLDQAARLAGLVGDLRAHVNLIPMNPTRGIAWTAPPVERQRAFRRVLERRGVAATIRHNRGGEIDAACGQLYADYALGSGRVLPAGERAWQRWSLPLAGVRR